MTGTLAAFGAFASGMLARPIGGILFGHFGDRIGRKSMLTLSLLLMGICTVLIGLLPTYEQIGISAAVLLVVLHIGQGLSFGGEMGGAMLMAVEHAPPKWKAFFGSLPLVGAPLGILLPVGSFALVTRLPEADFLSWGWRLPFLASAVLIVVGLFIRHGIDESPEFEAVKRDRARARQPLEDKMPLRELLRAHGRSLLLCIGCKIAEVTLIYTFLVFSVSYAVSKLGFSRADALHALLYGAGVLMFTIPLFGMLGDRIGRAPRLWLGRHAAGTDGHSYFLAVGSGSLVAYSLAVFVAMAFNYAIMIAPQSSLYSAQFPRNCAIPAVHRGPVLRRHRRRPGAPDLGHAGSEVRQHSSRGHLPGVPRRRRGHLGVSHETHAAGPAPRLTESARLRAAAAGLLAVQGGRHTEAFMKAADEMARMQETAGRGDFLDFDVSAPWILQRLPSQLQAALAHVAGVLQRARLEQPVHPARGDAQHIRHGLHREFRIGDMGIDVAGQHLPVVGRGPCVARDLLQRLAGVDRGQQRQQRLLGEERRHGIGFCLVEEHMTQAAMRGLHQRQAGHPRCAVNWDIARLCAPSRRDSGPLTTTMRESVYIRISDGRAVVRKMMSPGSRGRVASFWTMTPCPAITKLARNSACCRSAACSARCCTAIGVDSRLTTRPPARSLQACNCSRGCSVSARNSPGRTSLSSSRSYPATSCA